MNKSTKLSRYKWQSNPNCPGSTTRLTKTVSEYMILVQLRSGFCPGTVLVGLFLSRVSFGKFVFHPGQLLEGSIFAPK